MTGTDEEGEQLALLAGGGAARPRRLRGEDPPAEDRPVARRAGRHRAGPPRPALRVPRPRLDGRGCRSRRPGQGALRRAGPRRLGPRAARHPRARRPAEPAAPARLPGAGADPRGPRCRPCGGRPLRGHARRRPAARGAAAARPRPSRRWPPRRPSTRPCRSTPTWPGGRSRPVRRSSRGSARGARRGHRSWPCPRSGRPRPGPRSSRVRCERRSRVAGGRWSSSPTTATSSAWRPRSWPPSGPGRHTRLTADQGPQARYTAFLKALRGHVPVVVGTRAAGFAPVRDLGLVVWWDDGDDLLDEPRAPYPHVREVLLARAAREGAAVLRGRAGALGRGRRPRRLRPAERGRGRPGPRCARRCPRSGWRGRATTRGATPPSPRRTCPPSRGARPRRRWPAARCSSRCRVAGTCRRCRARTAARPARCRGLRGSARRSPVPRARPPAGGAGGSRPPSPARPARAPACARRSSGRGARRRSSGGPSRGSRSSGRARGASSTWSRARRASWCPRRARSPSPTEATRPRCSSTRGPSSTGRPSMRARRPCAAGARPRRSSARRRRAAGRAGRCAAARHRPGGRGARALGPRVVRRARARRAARAVPARRRPAGGAHRLAPGGRGGARRAASCRRPRRRWGRSRTASSAGGPWSPCRSTRRPALARELAALRARASARKDPDPVTVRVDPRDPAS